MSWSFSGMGRPAKVVEALEKHMATAPAGDLSRIEYEEAKPHLIGLVRQNFSADTDVLIVLEASGSGSSTRKSDGGEWEHKQRQCQVKLERRYNNLLL